MGEKHKAKETLKNAKTQITRVVSDTENLPRSTRFRSRVYNCYTQHGVKGLQSNTGLDIIFSSCDVFEMWFNTCF